MRGGIIGGDVNNGCNRPDLCSGTENISLFSDCCSRVPDGTTVMVMKAGWGTFDVTA